MRGGEERGGRDSELLLVMALTRTNRPAVLGREERARLASIRVDRCGNACHDDQESTGFQNSARGRKKSALAERVLGSGRRDGGREKMEEVARSDVIEPTIRSSRSSGLSMKEVASKSRNKGCAENREEEGVSLTSADKIGRNAGELCPKELRDKKAQLCGDLRGDRQRVESHQKVWNISKTVRGHVIALVLLSTDSGQDRLLL
jgi:hypothetical protein